MNNYLAGEENDNTIHKVGSEIVTFKAQHSKKDTETNVCSIAIPDNISLPQTGNLPADLKFCVSTRVMLADNINVFDRIINGSIRTVKHLDIRSNSLCSAIYVKCDNPKAGNSMKDGRLRNELIECVPITTRTNKFALKKGKITVIAERKQFPLVLGHAITAHKSQGSTLNYMKTDLSRSTGKKIATSKTYQQPINQGQFLHQNEVLLLNFDLEQIKVHESALKEMVSIGQESVFSWQHPLKSFSDTSICLLNIGY